jgi:hypothetical protein
MGDIFQEELVDGRWFVFSRFVVALGEHCIELGGAICFGKLGGVAVRHSCCDCLSQFGEVGMSSKEEHELVEGSELGAGVEGSGPWIAHEPLKVVVIAFKEAGVEGQV